MNITKCIKAVERDRKVIADSSRISYYPLVISSIDGATIEDIDGNKYIDLLSSAGALNVGGSNSRVKEAIIEQLSKFIHYTPAYSYHEPMIRLAEKLIEITPGNYSKKVAFGLSGSDANDGIIKFARAYTGRSSIITFIGAYHGSTYGSMTMSAITPKMRRKIGPFVPDIHSFMYPNCYRCNFGKSEDCCNLECLEQIKEAFKNYIPIDEVAAIIIEPIQGDGGIIVPPKKYIKKLYELCIKNKILFVSEEVQQGFGRTGKWFGIDNFDVIPDAVILGKSIASGMPLSAIVAREEIMQSLEAPAHAFTTAANPVCCCAALSTIEIISEKGFLEHVNKIGNLVKEYFNKIKDAYEIIGDVRGLGLSIGVELVTDRIKKEKDIQAASKICYRCYEKGVVLITLNGNVLRIQPPLNITEKEMSKALEIIKSSIDDYLGGRIADDVLKLVKGW
ncbi:4-aminobutyrate aminotransferase [Anaerosolibacter carboniphilus]|uniref:(S)-3-amino-2-methylpropionate transaminase n=1 Tax=Anaerosolibacter carboniphilus TaxID=1417629 RepID=A0A841L6B5_9FIRM|nr:aspartate aminotransferase family protein [Anaerosolibacter carboniphilus]MBB6217835.1 4-aminobutyrate aminotransferase [Anaerosolibacter carboniphilus]